MDALHNGYYILVWDYTGSRLDHLLFAGRQWRSSCGEWGRESPRSGWSHQFWGCLLWGPLPLNVHPDHSPPRLHPRRNGPRANGVHGGLQNSRWPKFISRQRNFSLWILWLDNIMLYNKVTEVFLVLKKISIKKIPHTGDTQSLDQFG